MLQATKLYGFYQNPVGILSLAADQSDCMICYIYNSFHDGAVPHKVHFVPQGRWKPHVRSWQLLSLFNKAGYQQMALVVTMS